jgi:methanogenic corrinoid protein MtbC1
MRPSESTLPGLDAHAQFVANLLASTRKALAAGAALRVGQSQGPAAGQSGRFSQRKAQADALLLHLEAAVLVGEPALYADQVAWLKQAFAARAEPRGELRALLAALRDELASQLPPEAARPAAACAERGLAHFDAAPDDVPSALAAPGTGSRRMQRYLLALLEGRRQDALRIAEEALDDGFDVPAVHAQLIVPALCEIGRLWQRGELNVAEEHRGSRITESVLCALSARMHRPEPNGKRVLITSANGDLHDIGLRMVADQFESAGWESIFLGASTPGEDAARAVEDFQVDCAAIGARLVLHVRAAAELVAAVRATPRGRTLPIVVGGRPFALAPDLARALGADAAARDPAEALAQAERLVAARG